MVPLSSHVDAVMARAVVTDFSSRTSGSRWCAYLPGSSVWSVWRDDSTEALAGLRELVVKDWLEVLRELSLSAPRAAVEGGAL